MNVCLFIYNTVKLKLCNFMIQIEQNKESFNEDEDF